MATKQVGYGFLGLSLAFFKNGHLDRCDTGSVD